MTEFAHISASIASHLTMLLIGGGLVSIGWSIDIMRRLRLDRIDRERLRRECLDADAIHGDVPALRRGEVVHDYTEAAQ